MGLNRKEFYSHYVFSFFLLLIPGIWTGTTVISIELVIVLAAMSIPWAMINPTTNRLTKTVSYLLRKISFGKMAAYSVFLQALSSVGLAVMMARACPQTSLYLPAGYFLLGLFVIGLSLLVAACLRGVAEWGVEVQNFLFSTITNQNLVKKP